MVRANINPVQWWNGDATTAYFSWNPGCSGGPSIRVAGAPPPLSMHPAPNLHAGRRTHWLQCVFFFFWSTRLKPEALIGFKKGWIFAIVTLILLPANKEAGPETRVLIGWKEEWAHWPRRRVGTVWWQALELYRWGAADQSHAEYGQRCDSPRCEYCTETDLTAVWPTDQLGGWSPLPSW